MVSGDHWDFSVLFLCFFSPPVRCLVALDTTFCAYHGENKGMGTIGEISERQLGLYVGLYVRIWRRQERVCLSC